MSTRDPSSSLHTAWATCTSSTSCCSRHKPGKISTLRASFPWVPPGEAPSSPCVSWHPVGDSLCAVASLFPFPPAEMEGCWWAGKGHSGERCGGPSSCLASLQPRKPQSLANADSSEYLQVTSPKRHETKNRVLEGFNIWPLASLLSHLLIFFSVATRARDIFKVI